MVPTHDQVLELKRIFSADHAAYNWSLDRVKNHKEAPNCISLRNLFRRANPLPNWAEDENDKPIVASHILAGSIKQLTD